MCVAWFIYCVVVAPCFMHRNRGDEHRIEYQSFGMALHGWRGDFACRLDSGTGTYHYLGQEVSGTADRQQGTQGLI